MESSSEALMFIQQMFIEYFLCARYNDIGISMLWVFIKKETKMIKSDIGMA